MAEEDILTNVLSYDYLGIVSIVMWSIIVIAIVGAIAWFIYNNAKYNKMIIVRDETAGGNIVRNRKAREKINKTTGVLEWYIKGEKVTVPCPPKEALGITPDGKKIAEIVRVQGDQYVWLDISKFKENGDGSGKFLVVSEDAKRQLAEQIQKAEQEKTTKLNQLISQAVPLIMVGICILGAYFIFDTIGEKMAEVSENVAGMSTAFIEVSKQNAELISVAKEIITEREQQKLYGNNVTKTIPN